MKATTKILSAIAVLGMATSAFAASLTLTATNERSNWNLGGAYTASNLVGLSSASYSTLTGSTSTSFETFCLEPSEHFYSGYTYNTTIDSKAYGGGVDNHDVTGNPAGDPLSIGTAYLYSQFAQGILSGYNYSSDATRKSSNLQLQQAFWFLEDDFGVAGADGLTGQYTTLTAALANPFLSLVASLGTGATSELKLDSMRANAAVGLYGVTVLNLTDQKTGENSQSQLYYSKVPEAGTTVGMFGLAILGFAAFRRRFISRR